MTLLTLLLVFIGDYAGGQQGMMIMLIFSLAINFFTYWNSDKMVLAQYRAPALLKSVRRAGDMSSAF